MLAVTTFISYLRPKSVTQDTKVCYYSLHLIINACTNLLNNRSSRFINKGILMIKYSNSEWNYNLKRRRELHEYKESPVKSTSLVPVYIRVVSSLFICSNINKRLDIVIGNSVFKKFSVINLLYL